MTSPKVKSQSGIIKNEEKVEMAVMVIERFYKKSNWISNIESTQRVHLRFTRLPPSIRVHMFEAPPPGETPVTKRPLNIMVGYKKAHILCFFLPT